MYGQLVRVIWECKRFLNWLVSIRNWPKLFATRYKINKYKVLHIVLYASYAYKNKNRTMSFQSFQLNCPAADLFCRFRNLKNKEGFIGVFSTTFFFRKRLNPAHYCCNFAFFNRVQKKVPYWIQYILRTPMSMEAHWR